MRDKLRRRSNLRGKGERYHALILCHVGIGFGIYVLPRNRRSEPGPLRSLRQSEAFNVVGVFAAFADAPVPADVAELTRLAIYRQGAAK